MDIVQILIMLAIGAVAGWLAGNIMRGGGFGLIGNIIVGVVGSIIGRFIGEMLGAGGGNVLTIPGPPIVGVLIWATLGAVVLLLIIGLIRKIL